jgi:arylsulfatase A-like enzyme
MKAIYRREFLKTLGLGVAAAAVPCLARGQAPPVTAAKGLNLVFLFADQMHGFAMGCMGDKQIRTPHLDRLAQEGVLFRNAYSSAPVCTPFRGTLFTGRYGSQTGILSNERPLPQGEKTLADCLSAAGYRTSYVGKWHLGGAGNEAVPAALRGGFTDFIGYQCYNDFLENVIFFDEDGRKVNLHKHRTETTTDLAIQRLERAAAAGPFALFVSYQNPHYPVQPSPEYEAMYRDAKIARRPNARDIDPYTATASPKSPKKEDDANYRAYGGNLDRYLQLYYAMVTQLDANVSRVLAALDRLGIADRTAVIFTSDHGDMQGSHGLKNKSLPWEESVRIPCVVRVPGGAKGAVLDVPVSSVDYLPTCLDLAGAPPLATAAGVSFAPLARGQAGDVARPVFAEMKGWCLIRRGDLKLVASRPALKPTHIFNLKDDPYEMKNLVDDPAHEAVKQELLIALTEWNRRVSARG